MNQSSWRGPRRVLLVLLLALVGAVLFLRTRFAADQTCRLARRHLPALLDLDVGIGSCELDPLEQKLTLHGLSLFEPGSDRSVFAAEEAQLSLKRLRVFSGGVELELLKVVRPRVRVDASAPAPKAGDKASAGACPLEALRRVAIDHLDIQGGELAVALPEGRSLELRGVDISWRVRRGLAELNALAEQGRLKLNGPNGKGEVPISRLALEGGFDGDALRLEISRGQLQVDEATLEAVGKVEDLCRPTLGLDAQVYLPMATLGKLLPLPPDASGQAWARVVAEGTPQAPRLTAEVVGTGIALGKFNPGDFKARASLAGDDLNLTELELGAGPGTVKVEGAIKLAPGLPVRARVDLQDAEFARVMERAGVPGAWVDFFATGKGSVQGHLLPSPHLTGEADVRAARFTLAPHPFDQPDTPKAGRILAFERARVVTGLKVLPDRVEFTGARVETEHGRVQAEVSLFYDPLEGISIRGETDALDLSDFGQISGIHWAGRGAGHFEIEGPMAHVRVDSELSFRDFAFWNFSLGVVQAKLQYSDLSLVFPAVTGQKGRTLYTGSGALDFRPDSQGGLHTSGRVFVFGGRTEDLVDMTAGISPNIALFQGALSGDADGAVLIDCPASALDGVVKLNLRNTTYYGRRLGEGDAVLSFVRGESMVLEKAKLDGPAGHLFAEGSLHFDGPLDYRFRGDGLSLRELVGAERAQKWGVDGALTMVGTATGDATTPVVRAYVTSPSVAFAGKDLGDMHLEGQIQGKELQVFGRPFGGAHANLRMTLADAFPYEGQVSLSLPEIRPLLPEGAISQGLSGSLAGTVTADGTLYPAPSGKPLQAKAVLDKFSLSRGDFQGANEGPIELSYQAGKLGVDAFKFVGPNTEIVAAGAVAPEAVDLSLTGKLDMRLLESFVPALERTAGRVELAASLGGTVENPTLVGNAQVYDARLTVRDQPLTFRALSGRVDFSEARVVASEVNGLLNEAQVQADANLRLDRLSISQMQVRMLLDNVPLTVADLPVTVAGELMLHGKPAAPVLSGNLDLVKLRYERPVELDSLVKQMLTPQPLAVSDKSKEWLALDLDLHAKGDVRIENNVVKAHVRGDAHVGGTNTHPVLFTQTPLYIAEGGQLFFRDNQFSITQATFDFKDKQRLDPFINVKAETRIRDEYQVQLHAFGKASNPQLVFQSDPPLPEQDIFTLMAMRVTSRDRSNTAGAGLGLASEVLFSTSGLDKFVQKFVPSTFLLKDFKFSMSTTYNEGTGVVEPAAQFQSKFLTDKLMLRATEPVSGKGTKTQGEYRFSPNTSLQLQWDNVQSESSFGNFGLLLMLRGEVQ